MSSTADEAATRPVRSLVPARMDRLPWTRFHWLVVASLGITWILDGLEVQMASQVGTVLQDRQTFHISAAEVGAIASVYLAGEVVGALWFGRLSDKLGRRKLFIATLGIYLLASGLAGLSVNIWMFYVFRFIAGMGIGGEYTAINSAIDELIPAKYRGRCDVAINGTYWAGAAIGAAAEIFLLDPDLLPINLGWRIGFLIGPFLGLVIIMLRRNVPESPRWLMTHGRIQESEKIADDIEEKYVTARGGSLEPVDDSSAIEVRPRGAATYREITRVMVRSYPSRSILGFTLMVTQSFLYNAIFFTFGLVLSNIYGIESKNLGYFFFPFAAGNLLGPLLLGRYFDTLGRKKMIGGTYTISAVLLAISGYLFQIGALSATTQTVFWCVIFFFASAGASAGYLTVSEIFPLELRAQAISYFFAISQLIGGVGAPTLYAALVGASDNGANPTPLTIGYMIGAALMFVGGVVEFVIGVNAEGKSLEEIANPLAVVRKIAEATTPSGGPQPEPGPAG